MGITTLSGNLLSGSPVGLRGGDDLAGPCLADLPGHEADRRPASSMIRSRFLTSGANNETGMVQSLSACAPGSR